MTINKSKIPVFKSIEEESKFWDTHSIADFSEQLKPVHVRFAKNLSDTIKSTRMNWPNDHIRLLKNLWKGMDATKFVKSERNNW